MGLMEYSNNNQFSDEQESNYTRSTEYNNAELEELLPKRNFKKIVVYIYGRDNINYIDSLSTEERNSIVNEILETSRIKSFYQIKKEAVRNFTLQILIIILSVIIAVPIIYIVSNNVYHFSQKITKDNYSGYGKNFEKLYEDKNYQSNPRFRK